MSVIRQVPWSALNQLHCELDRVFDNRRQPDEASSAVADWTPAVDIREEDERFVLRADVPGVDPEAIEITMEDGILTVQGSREETRREQENGYRRVERVSGRFHRRFTLPDTADAEGISARSSNGVLEVFIPKQARVQPRRIEIEAA